MSAQGREEDERCGRRRPSGRRQKRGKVFPKQTSRRARKIIRALRPGCIQNQAAARTAPGGRTLRSRSTDRAGRRDAPTRVQTKLRLRPTRNAYCQRRHAPRKCIILVGIQEKTRAREKYPLLLGSKHDNINLHKKTKSGDPK